MHAWVDEGVVHEVAGLGALARQRETHVNDPNDPIQQPQLPWDAETPPQTQQQRPMQHDPESVQQQQAVCDRVCMIMQCTVCLFS